MGSINKDITQVMEPEHFLKLQSQSSSLNNNKQIKSKKQVNDYNNFSKSKIAYENQTDKQSPKNNWSSYSQSANRRHGSQNSHENSAKQHSHNRGRSLKAKQSDQQSGNQQVKKPMSRYMQELIRLNMIDMVHRYDKHQKTKRI